MRTDRSFRVWISYEMKVSWILNDRKSEDCPSSVVDFVFAISE